MKLNVGIIGCGRIAYLLEKDSKRLKPATHIGALQQLHNFYNIIACADLDKERLDIMKKDFPNLHIYIDYIEMIRTKQLDIIIIASPTNTHLYILNDLLSFNNIKGIVLEKPIGTDIKLARAILKKIEKSQTIVAVNHERRYDSQYNYVKQFIKEQKAGAYIFGRGTITARQSANISNSILFHDGTHLIDIIQFLFGDIEWVRVISGKSLEDFITVQLYTYQQQEIICTFSYQHNFFHFEMELWFERGKINIGNGIFNISISKNSPFYNGFNSLIDENIVVKKNKYFIKLYENLYNSISGNETLISSYYNGFKVLKIMHSILVSMRKGKKIKVK